MVLVQRQLWSHFTAVQVLIVQALAISGITVSDIIVEINYTPPFTNFPSLRISPEIWPFLYMATLTKQLLGMVCMRVRYNDINNQPLLLCISPLTAESQKQEVKRTPWSRRFPACSQPSMNLLEQWTIPSWPHKKNGGSTEWHIRSVNYLFSPLVWFSVLISTIPLSAVQYKCAMISICLSNLAH